MCCEAIKRWQVGVVPEALFSVLLAFVYTKLPFHEGLRNMD